MITSDASPDDRLIDWVPFGFLNGSDAVSNSLVTLYENSDDLVLRLIQNDPNSPFPLYLMPSFLFDQLVSHERSAFIIPTSLNYEHEDDIVIIAIDDVGNPTGDWIEAVVHFQDYAGTRSEGLCDGFDLVVFEL
jgi:hypothetical protein